MKRKLLLTSDGSHTITIPEWQVTYHSIHGAVQESRHVFIEAGLDYILSKFAGAGDACLRVFEMGFGTGLNALLSYAKTKGANRCLYYQATELYPLSPEEAGALNYVSILQDDSLQQPLLQMHQCAAGEDIPVSSFFTFHKSIASLQDIRISLPFHLIYFDAFAPDVQPELWTLPVFQQMHSMLYEGGALVTYCSKGSVRRTLQAVGFTVEKLKGPPGKREIIRAIKKAY